MQTLADLASAGVISDQPSFELADGAWNYGNNIAFRAGSIERAPGYGALYDPPSVAPYQLFGTVAATGARYTVYAGLAAVYAVSTTTHYNITRSSGGAYAATADKRWTGGVLGGILVINNGVDDPQYWTPQAGGNLAALTAWPASTKCAVMRVYQNYLIALDVTASGTRKPHLVKWSHPADPGALPSSWDETDTTKNAGQLDLGETQGVLIDCMPLAESNIIYKEDAIYSQIPRDDSYVFTFKCLSKDAGMLAANCGAVFPGGHVVLTPGDVIMFDGQQPKSIVDGRMRKWLFNNLDSTNYKRSFVVANPRRQEVMVCFPSSGASACDTALVWSWENNNFSVRELSNMTCGVYTQIDASATGTWSADADPWYLDSSGWNSTEFSQNDKRLLLGSTNTKIYALEFGATAGGTAYASTLERTGMTFGDPSAVKVVRAIWPRVSASAGTTLTFQVGGQMRPTDPVSWSPAQTWTAGSSSKIDVFAAGRYIALRVASSTAVWRLRSMDIDVQTRGGF